MSHFTTIKVQIKNSDTLFQVLQELGYQVECNTNVRGYRGTTTLADYVIRQKNGYDLGFRRAGENYEIIADFWGAGNQSKGVCQLNYSKVRPQNIDGNNPRARA